VLRASVTPKGLQILMSCDEDMDAIEADMLGELPAETIEIVREALWSCAHGLEVTLPTGRNRPRAVPRKR
jgi:DNA-binding MarR family transcriptional regulator